MPKLSAFLIVKNEAADIDDCLKSLKGVADEIVVVDDQSTDQTVSLCKAHGARTFSRVLDGFAAQKQYALDQTTGEWAFSIDADERITPDLAAEIRKILEQPASTDGYYVRRNFYFLGRRLSHGGLGNDWVLRLFRRSKGRFKPVKVHESIEVSGTTARLQAPLEHYSYSSIAEYNEKANHYTTLAARELWTRGRRSSPLDFLRPGWELFSRVVLKSAWMDGRPGMMYAAFSSHTAWVRAMKLWEIQHRG